MTAIPPEAIDAAAEALCGYAEDRRYAATVALEAAAPHIAAAERERIRQLAIREQAVCTGTEGTQCYFADLLEPAP